jgi:hypothetical protein
MWQAVQAGCGRQCERDGPVQRMLVGSTLRAPQPLPCRRARQPSRAAHPCCVLAASRPPCPRLTRVPSLLCRLVPGEDAHAHGLAGAVRQGGRAAHHLVAAARVDAQAQVQLQRLVKARARQRLRLPDRVLQRRRGSRSRGAGKNRAVRAGECVWGEGEQGPAACCWGQKQARMWGAR